MRKNIIFLIFVCALSLVGCDNSRTTTQFNSSSQNYLLDADCFDLQSVVQIVKSNQVKNAEELENLINSAGSAINNVDLDGDGHIDFVAVSEQSQGNLDFIAYPESQGSEGTTIANVKFSVNSQTNQVTVTGGYPSYVSGYDSHYYHYSVPRGPSFGQMLFLSYMTNAMRPRYYHDYSYYRSRPIYTTHRSVYSPSLLRSSRTTYRTKYKITPARTVTRPKTYTIRSASKVKSRLASKRTVTKSSSLRSRSGTSRSYVKRSSNKTKKFGSAFGASKKKTTTKSSWGSSSRTSKRSSSSWKSPRKSSSSSSRSRSKSSWGSSSRSRSKSSWGSSRKRR